VGQLQVVQYTSNWTPQTDEREKDRKTYEEMMARNLPNLLKTVNKEI
jgi:hypothetical protein